MLVIEPSYEIILPMPFDDMLRHIERCGRLCYKSEGLATDESWRTWVGDKIAIGHESIIEHCGFTVIFTMDRGVTHEVVRHRLASYSQESTRYCNYNKGKFGGSITYIDIKAGIALDTKMKDLDADTIQAIISEWYMAMLDAENHYMNMIKLGATPQIARSVLPNSTKADIAVTTNIREWRKILSLRTGITAHPQMREIMIRLLHDLQKQCHQLFGDIGGK